MAEDIGYARLNLLGTHRAKFAGLETFDCPGRIASIAMTSDEVTALCPVTGQPDLYVVAIEYRPEKLCVESKSLKLYLHSFRSEGVFAEALASRILADVVAACSPGHCMVCVTQKSRGGVSIVAKAETDQ